MSADLNILVVDDNEDLAVNIKDILHEKGYRATVALSGADAVERCGAASFDLVLLDYNLPDMDGLQVQERLSSLIQADYVIITGYASVESAASSVFRKEIVGYETKPLNMERLLAFIRQIDDRRRAERELQRSRERRRTLYEAITDALFVHGLEADGAMGHFREVNDIACDRYGYSREELLTLSPPDIDAPESETDVPAILEKLNRGESVTFEQLHVAKDGRRIPVEIHAKSFHLDGQPAVISLVRDIADRKKAEEDRRRMERRLQDLQRQESLGVMAGGIAHDFNNILMVVIGNLEMALEDDALSAETQDNLAESIKASQRAAKLVKQMLAYSGKGHFVVTPLDLNETVEEGVDFVKSAVPSEVTLETRLSPDDPVIDADAGQLNQILSNLVVNACESLQGRKEGRVVIATGVETCNAERLEGTAPEAWLGYDGPLEGVCCGYLEVRDNGCGMDAETRKRIFEPFFSTKFQGRGLGLAAVIGIVRGHKGFVHVDSTPGEGTVVRVLFPLRESPPKPTVPGPPAETERRPQGSGRVLVVDDEKPVRDMIGTMLEKAGYSVISAANGLEAVSHYHQRPDDIDLILMDLSMPLMDGVEAFMELRRTGCDAPVILSSGYSESQIRREYAGKGFAGFIQKPCLKKTLFQAVGAAMGGTAPD